MVMTEEEVRKYLKGKHVLYQGFHCQELVKAEDVIRCNYGQHLVVSGRYKLKKDDRHYQTASGESLYWVKGLVKVSYNKHNKRYVLYKAEGWK